MLNGRPTRFDARYRPHKQRVLVLDVRLCRERPASSNGLRPLPLATAERFPSQYEWLEGGGTEEESLEKRQPPAVWTLSG
jgi:hypothetical protein